MPFINRNTQGGTSVSSGSLAPRSNRTGTGQVDERWVGVLPPMPIPTFGSVTPTSGGWTAPITNYDSAATYVLTTTAGSVSQTSGTITQTGLGNNASATVTVTVSKTGFSSSVAVIAGTSQSKLATPTLSGASATTGGFTFTITNYDAANTYTISTSAGSVSRSGSTITQSGLANGASATVSVTASRTGFVTSDTATRTGTSTPNCSSCTYAYTQVEGGNCCCTGMCGAPNQVCCYNIVVYTGNPSGCIGCNASIGSWYACDGTC